jgi:polyisoprenoid-binding protein YceI
MISKKLLFGVVMVMVMMVAAVVAMVGYAVLKPTAEASAPVQAIPLQVEATTSGAAAPVSAAAPAASGKAILFEIDGAHSEARFLIDEVLQGAPKEVVGVTKQVAGQIAVNPANPSATQVGTILINARTFATDSTQRDRAIQNVILTTNQYEYVTFKPARVEGLTAASADQPVSFRMYGDLTIRDVTREVSFDVTLTAAGEDRLEGRATASINYADWGIAIPKVPMVASVADVVELELQFVARPV